MTDRPHRRAAAWLALGLLAALSASFLVPPGPTAAATVSVAVENYDFAPASRTINVDDTVRWTFSGDPHSVTSSDGIFDSGIKDAGGSFQFRFQEAGTYRYYCVVHPSLMTGTIIVKAPSTTPRPTLRPTPTPTPTHRSTPRPTPKPTVRATVKPAATPTPALTPPAVSSSPPPSAAPSASDSPGASQALVETPGPSTAPPSAAPAPGPQTGASDTTPIVAGGVLLAVIAIGGGLALARRRRSP